MSVQFDEKLLDQLVGQINTQDDLPSFCFFIFKIATIGLLVGELVFTTENMAN